MSFIEQERALFTLLFDEHVREDFCASGVKALKSFQLTPEELDDFSFVKPSAIQTDALMRTNLILSQLCRQYPMSFSLLSTFDSGLKYLRSLIDVETMQATPNHRATVLGNRLKQLLMETPFERDEEHALFLSIIDTELGMASTAASLLQAVNDGHYSKPQVFNLHDDWDSQAMHISLYVSAAIIPEPLVNIKKVLCPVSGSSLWRHLSTTPTRVDAREHLACHNDQRFLACRAEMMNETFCEPTIEYRTVELSPGFAELLQQVDGKYSVNDLLLQMKAVGADEDLLGSIRTGFMELLTSGILQISSQP